MTTSYVIPAQAGIQYHVPLAILDSRLRGNDGRLCWHAKHVRQLVWQEPTFDWLEPPTKGNIMAPCQLVWQGAK